jgi:putative NADH-flavin reductase
VIQQAIVSGYEIKELVRAAEKPGVLQGDIFNISDLEPVIKGTEAIVSALVPLVLDQDGTPIFHLYSIEFSSLLFLAGPLRICIGWSKL